METAYLQLVMRRLWDEEIAAGSQRLRLETLQRLGGADTIVHGHLDEVMAKLPEEQRDAAAGAFRFLVTSGGRKIALSSQELREFSDVPKRALEPALEHLERARILRPIPSSEPDGVGRREIYHDVLAPAVLEWRRRARRQGADAPAWATRGAKPAPGCRGRRAPVVAARWRSTSGIRARCSGGAADRRRAVRGAGAQRPRPSDRLDRGGRQDPRAMPSASVRSPSRVVGTRRCSSAFAATAQRPSRSISASRADAKTTFEGDRELLDAIRATRDRLVLAFNDFAIVRKYANSGPW